MLEPPSIPTSKPSYAIKTMYIVNLLEYGPILKLMGEFMEPCSPYQNTHHQLMVAIGLQ